MVGLFKNTFRIESTRLKEYDYSQPGGYFVTICTRDRECLLGEVQDEEMILSPVGKIARRCWEKIPHHFNNITLDAFVIMPNHIHGIVFINDKDDDTESTKCRDAQLNVSTGISPKRGTLSVVIRTYKAAVTTMCRRNGYENFKWQSRFYEHIIRDERDLQNTRDYIINNPIKWFYDENNREKKK